MIYLIYSQFLVYRHAAHPRRRSSRRAERHRVGHTRRDGPSLAKAEDYGGLGERTRGTDGLQRQRRIRGGSYTN